MDLQNARALLLLQSSAVGNYLARGDRRIERHRLHAVGAQLDAVAAGGEL
jgi:hypothetical protein